MSINTAAINRAAVVSTVGNWPDPMRQLG